MRDGSDSTFSDEDVAFGAKTIGIVGSISMLLNNILGPGIANFSGLFQQAGWLMPTMFIIMCAVSSLAGGEMLIIAMRNIPGNSQFLKRVEFSTLCSHYLPSKSATFLIVMFQLAMLCANIGNIIQTSQVIDQTIASLFGDSCALEFSPQFRFFCSYDSHDITPFGVGRTLLPLGAVIVAACSVPLGFWNLDDNIIVQNLAMILIVSSMAVWAVIFFSLGVHPDRMPVIRTEFGSSAFHGAWSTILFNFMFISTLPSWMCEKHPSVTAMPVIGVTLVLAVVLFLFVGIGGGLAMPILFTSDNSLFSSLQHIDNGAWSQWAIVSVDVYAISSNLSSIPIFSIMVRYNLIQQKIVGPRVAGFVAIVLPWVISVLLYTGNGFRTVVHFGGAFSSSIVNLIAPSLFYIASTRSTNIISDSTLPMLEPSDDSIRSDKSGYIGSADAQWRWLKVAWINIVVMSIVTVIAFADQVWGQRPILT